MKKFKKNSKNSKNQKSAKSKKIFSMKKANFVLYFRVK